MKASPAISDRLRKMALVSSLSAWVVIAFAFIGLLGGTHPSNEVRDRVVLSAGALFILLSVPLAAQTIALPAPRHSSRGSRVMWLVLLVHFTAGVLVLRFVHGISHDTPVHWFD